MAKGRVAIPTRYRAEIMEKNQGQMVCTVDIRQPCLLLYPLDEWEKIEQKLLSLSNFDPNQRRLQRVMLGYATECEMDAQGRILLSGPLRQHAKLEKGLMLVGQLNKLKFGVIPNGMHKLMKISKLAQVLNSELLKN